MPDTPAVPFARPKFGHLRTAIAYSGISRTRLYELAPRVPGLLRKLDRRTLVDFEKLDRLLNELPSFEPKSVA